LDPTKIAAETALRGRGGRMAQCLAYRQRWDSCAAGSLGARPTLATFALARAPSFACSKPRLYAGPVLHFWHSRRTLCPRDALPIHS